MEEKSIEDIAYECGYRLIGTTTNGNGYPESCKHAIIGFKCYEEAQKLAAQYNLKITSFFKREGWQLWVRSKHESFSSLTITAEDYGDNYAVYHHSDAEEFFENEVKARLDNFNDFDSLEKFIKDKRELLEAIEAIDDSQMVIAYCGQYYETIDINPMEWSHDTKTYAIGVIKYLSNTGG